jgi:hypothetical protein
MLILDPFKKFKKVPAKKVISIKSVELMYFSPFSTKVQKFSAQ